jgi:DNA-directed RNA polymerase subunit RPC12/RpoP
MANCDHCQVLISDPTVQVVHGDKTFCCPNCSAAMEQGGSGSDPRTLEHTEDLACAHCGVRIVDEKTMVSRGDQAFCCSNCAAGMAVS